MSTTYETELTIIGDHENVTPATKELGGTISGGEGSCGFCYLCEEDEYLAFAQKHNVTLKVCELCIDSETSTCYTVTPYGVEYEEDSESESPVIP
ncbi:MAG: hypothetical protein H6827_09680 [Planctomycetes bacterium]|nr:hypothetical protein [Planctomycetota bacterium]